MPSDAEADADKQSSRDNGDPFLRYGDRFQRSLAAAINMLRSSDTVPAEIARSFGLPAAAVAGPASFFADFSAPRGRRHIRVCGAAACFAATGGRHVAEVEEALGVGAGNRSMDGAVSVQEVRCLGYCFSGPAALDGETACAGADLAAQLQGLAPRRTPPVPVHNDSPVPVVTAGLLGASEPWSTWPNIVASGTSEDVLRQVDAARLSGRGGAGFRVGTKWRAALAHPAARVVVANGDEGDPGSFVDRLLMERDPHRVLEGLALACFAVRAENAVVFVRSEYPQAFARMQEAVLEAQASGHLGTDIQGSCFSLEIDVVEGAGSYISGEETALLSGLEGLRAVPRPRPPYPTEHGLHGRPTVVNNVETLGAIPWIMQHGGAAYSAMGTPDEVGTVVACLSERFLRPGAYEVEIGTPFRRLVEDLGGGLRDGATLRALQIGGPLGGFIGPEDLDVPFSDATLSRYGAALGHAGVVAFDDTLAGEDVLRNLWDFAVAESCGQCSPCRVGAWRGRALVDRPGGPGDRGERDQVLRSMAVGSLCAFGRRVPAAVRSLARVYRLDGWLP
ncbi:NADH-ubiquinone oxidoreductase-F iron-sulfur binding region domain-containing protein [Paeniglutamicibacter kerguelensis]